MDDTNSAAIADARNRSGLGPRPRSRMAGMTPRSIFRTLALAILLPVAASACAATPHISTKEDVPMNSPVAAPLQADTAEAVGRRFLAMIASLNVPEDLSEEVLERAMQVHLEDTPAGRLANRPLNGDWVYVVFYTPESQGRRKGAVLQFANKVDRAASVADVCDLSFADYRDALLGMGFQESIQRDEIGRITNMLYDKKDFTIGVMPELRLDANGVAQPTCVKRIGF